MKVLLTKTVEAIGSIGDEKDVKPGYARNFLFPRRLAILPNHPQAQSFRKARRAAVAQLTVQQTLIREFAEQWRDKTYRLTARASEDGTLYGSIGLKEIRKALGRDDLTIEVPHLKTIGTHQIALTFADGTSIPVTIIIEPEGRAGERSKK